MARVQAQQIESAEPLEPLERLDLIVILKMAAEAATQKRCSVRSLAEATNNWIFHDERPLRLAEFESAIANLGRVESARILWPLILTQYCVVVRKFP